MNKSADRPFRKYPEQKQQIAIDGDQNEHIPALEELQHSRAERIRKIESTAGQGDKNKPA